MLRVAVSKYFGRLLSLHYSIQNVYNFCSRFALGSHLDRVRPKIVTWCHLISSPECNKIPTNIRSKGCGSKVPLVHNLNASKN